MKILVIHRHSCFKNTGNVCLMDPAHLSVPTKPLATIIHIQPRVNQRHVHNIEQNEKSMTWHTQIKRDDNKYSNFTGTLCVYKFL